MVLSQRSLCQHAVNGTSGELKWTFTTGYYATAFPALSSDESLVYLASGDQTVYALTTASGSLAWSAFATGQTMNNVAVAPDNTVYTTFSNNVLRAYDGSSGTVKWARYLSGSGDLQSPAIGADGTVYVSCDGAVWALNGTTGGTVWMYPLANGGTGTDTAVGSDGTVYTSSSTGHLYALDSSDGSVKWVFTGSGGGSLSSPVVDADRCVYVGSAVVYGVDPTGSTKWTYDPGCTMRGSGAAIDAAGVLYFGCSDNYLHTVNSTDGTFLGKQVASTHDSGNPSIGADGSVYLIGFTNVLVWRPQAEEATSATPTPTPTPAPSIPARRQPPWSQWQGNHYHTGQSVATGARLSTAATILYTGFASWSPGCSIGSDNTLYFGTGETAGVIVRTANRGGWCRKCGEFVIEHAVTVYSRCVDLKFTLDAST